jgi:hypothetical protein
MDATAPSARHICRTNRKINFKLRQERNQKYAAPDGAFLFANDELQRCRADGAENMLDRNYKPKYCQTMKLDRQVQTSQYIAVIKRLFL